MKRMLKIAVTTMLMMCAANSHADRRSYVWTYEYTTMPAGIAELEYYLTAKVPSLDNRTESYWQHQLELEYGLTDSWDISLYQMWSQSYKDEEDDSFAYDGFKVRTRYKLGEAGRWLLDPLLYLEYIRESDLDQPDELEAKLVLSRDLGPLNFSYNQVFEQAVDSGTELEYGYACGASYDFTDALCAGLEMKGSYSDSTLAAGPTLSLQTQSLWISCGSLLGMNERTDDFQARLITGIAF